MDTEPQITRLSDMSPGERGDCFVVLASRERARTRDGKPYFRVTFRDPRRTVTTMVWSDTAFFSDCDAHWEVGRFYKVRGLYAENQYGPQFELERIRETTDEDRDQGFDPTGFFPASRFDADKMFAELMQIVESHVSDKGLNRLVTELLLEQSDVIKQSTAAARNHHAFTGGFLEHVLSVTKTALYFAEKYAEYYPDMQPPLSKSLVIAGAVLHDIGKLSELKYQPQGAAYTAEGKLIGHILLGRDVVRDKGRTIPELDAEMLLRLEHIIVSHQNLPEWGSPIAPKFPEALLVHYADDVDAKFYMMAAALETSAGGDEEFTGRDNPLRREIFRGLRSGES